MSGAERPTEVAIGLGCNLGDREAQLERAVDALRATPGLSVRAVSSFHDTAPVGGPPDQPRYLNAALVGETTLAPRVLLAALQALERAAGRDRERQPRWGPRTLDLDLLVYGAQRLDAPGLTLPHPRLWERLFVLAPLAEVAPELRPPGRAETVAARAQALASAGSAP